MKSALVREWMTPDPVCATPDMTLPEARQLLKEQRVRRVPILKDGSLVGLVTLGDLRGAQPSEATSLSAYELDYRVSKVTLGQIMTADPVTVRPDQPVHEAALLMRDRHIGGLPVVDEQRLVGIITKSDVFRMIVAHWEHEERENAANGV